MIHETHFKIFRKLLVLYLEIHHFNYSLLYACNVTFEYFLPSYAALSSEIINQGFIGIKQRQLKYIVSLSITFFFYLGSGVGGSGGLVDVFIVS